jgi:4-aminobutyrate aminotransferase-like enzyme
MAVMDVIEAEGLQENARVTGTYMLDRLHGLRHPWLGRCAGRGCSTGWNS